VSFRRLATGCKTRNGISASGSRDLGRLRLFLLLADRGRGLVDLDMLLASFVIALNEYVDRSSPLGLFGSACHVIRAHSTSPSDLISSVYS